MACPKAALWAVLSAAMTADSMVDHWADSTDGTTVVAWVVWTAGMTVEVRAGKWAGWKEVLGPLRTLRTICLA